MTCYECHQQPGAGGLRFSDREAVGICRHCGKGLCQAHGVWRAATQELLCGACAAAPAGGELKQ
jgi:hypothetical protein